MTEETSWKPTPTVLEKPSSPSLCLYPSRFPAGAAGGVCRSALTLTLATPLLSRDAVCFGAIMIRGGHRSRPLIFAGGRADLNWTPPREGSLGFFSPWGTKVMSTLSGTNRGQRWGKKTTTTGAKQKFETEVEDRNKVYLPWEMTAVLRKCSSASASVSEAMQIMSFCYSFPLPRHYIHILPLHCTALAFVFIKKTNMEWLSSASVTLCFRLWSCCCLAWKQESCDLQV